MEVSEQLSCLGPGAPRQGPPGGNVGMTPVVLTCYLHVWPIHILDLNVYCVIWQPWHKQRVSEKAKILFEAV